MTAPASEISVIGGIIAFAEDTREAFRLLTPDMFTNAWLANTFAVCAELNRSEKKIDITTVESKIGKENRINLVRCVEQMPSLSGFHDYCAAVLEDWRRRTVCAELLAITGEQLPAKQLLERLDSISAKQRAIEQGLHDSTAVDFWGGVTRYLDALFRPNNAVKTGWSAFDRCTGGLQRKGFYIISGRSGMGKTDFALALATNLSAHYRVSYLSMEMPVEQLMERVISRMSRVDSNRLRDRTVTPDDMKRAGDALMLMKNKTYLTIDEKQRITPAELENKILRQSPDVVFVDHIGLMKHDSAKKVLWEAVADTSQRLKELAMKHNIVIVALAQEVYVTKNRHGGTGELFFHWQPQYHDWRAVDAGR